MDNDILDEKRLENEWKSIKSRKDDFEEINILDLLCPICKNQVIEIKRREEGRLQHVILCWKDQFTLHRVGV